MGERPTIVIAGAGIGGLTAALALAAKGFAVVVCERAQKLSEIGAGIQIAPNAGRVLTGLGLGRAIAAAAIEPRAIDIVDGPTGRLITAVATAAFASRYGVPYRVIHRADLQSILARAVERAGIRVELGTTVESYVTRPEGLLVRTGRSGGGTDVISTLAVVGADGVWSALRERVAGSARPVASGRTAWRAIIPTDVARDLVATDRVGLWLGPDTHLVHYPVAQGAAVNLVAVITEAWDRKGWSAPGDAAALSERFAGWSREARALLAAAISWQKFAILTVDPAAPWVADRLALIGDAAHAMVPFLAQGAAMAIEDAAVLADSLYGATDLSAALAAYADSRRPRVSRLAAAALHAGHIYHFAGVRALARNAALRVAGTHLVLGRNDWIYNWRPEVSETKSPHGSPAAVGRQTNG